MSRTIERTDLVNFLYSFFMFLTTELFDDLIIRGQDMCQLISCNVMALGQSTQNMPSGGPKKIPTVVMSWLNKHEHGKTYLCSVDFPWKPYMCVGYKGIQGGPDVNRSPVCCVTCHTQRTSRCIQTEGAQHDSPWLTPSSPHQSLQHQSKQSQPCGKPQTSQIPHILLKFQSVDSQPPVRISYNIFSHYSSLIILDLRMEVTVLHSQFPCFNCSHWEGFLYTIPIHNTHDSKECTNKRYRSTERWAASYNILTPSSTCSSTSNHLYHNSEN